MCLHQRPRGQSFGRKFSLGNSSLWQKDGEYATLAQEGSSLSKSESLFLDALKTLENKINAFCRGEGESYSSLRDILREIMTRKVGIFREADGLHQALETVQALKERQKKVCLRNRNLIFNQELINALDLEVQLDLAEVVVQSAFARKESRGSHFRIDFPQRDDTHWLRHTLAWRTKDGPKLEYKDVTITHYPPQERRY